jgi:DNA mismatch repair protein MSH6
MKEFEKQFWQIKQDHFDVVLFFKKGKFYELFEGIFCALLKSNF